MITPEQLDEWEELHKEDAVILALISEIKKLNEYRYGGMDICFTCGDESKKIDMFSAEEHFKTEDGDDILLSIKRFCSEKCLFGMMK